MAWHDELLPSGSAPPSSHPRLERLLEANADRTASGKRAPALLARATLEHTAAVAKLNSAIQRKDDDVRAFEAEMARGSGRAEVLNEWATTLADHDARIDALERLVSETGAAQTRANQMTSLHSEAAKRRAIVRKRAAILRDAQARYAEESRIAARAERLAATAAAALQQELALAGIHLPQPQSATSAVKDTPPPSACDRTHAAAADAAYDDDGGRSDEDAPHDSGAHSMGLSHDHDLRRARLWVDYGGHYSWCGGLIVSLRRCLRSLTEGPFSP